jgi:hypothetical protein
MRRFRGFEQNWEALVPSQEGSGGGCSLQRTRLSREFPGIREFCREIGRVRAVRSREHPRNPVVLLEKACHGQGIEMGWIREKHCRFSESILPNL